MLVKKLSLQNSITDLSVVIILVKNYHYKVNQILRHYSGFRNIPKTEYHNKIDKETTKNNQDEK